MLSAGRQKLAGFTLIEVIVALAIFAVCAVVLYEQSSRITYNRNQLSERELAMWVAKNELAEAKIRKPAVGSMTYNTAFASREWVSKVEVSETLQPKFFKISIITSLDSQPDVALAVLTGYVENF